jgi:hypothetical protein
VSPASTYKVTICSPGGKKRASSNIRPNITTIYCLKPLKGDLNLLALLKGFNRQKEFKKGRGSSNREEAQQVRYSASWQKKKVQETSTSEVSHASNHSKADS